MPKTKTEDLDFPPDTTVSIKKGVRNYRMTVSIRNTISLGSNTYSSIGPSISLSADIPEDADLMKEAVDIYNKITGPYAYLLISEAARVNKMVDTSIVSVAKQLMEAFGRGAVD